MGMGAMVKPDVGLGPSPAGPMDGPMGGGDPGEVRTMLVSMIARIRSIAEENGIDFEELVSSAGPASIKPPPPPVPG